MTGTGAGRRLRDGLPLVPFLAYVTIFLIIPTVTVLVGSVYLGGVFSLDRIHVLFSGTTAVVGAFLGAVLAYLIVTAPPTSVLRRLVLSVCSVLAQFGGVALAFAFVATIGLNG